MAIKCSIGSGDRVYQQRQTQYESGDPIMNTREENVASAMREAEQSEQTKQIRRGNLEWAKNWRDGDAKCPCCGGIEFDIVDVESEGRLRYETFRCKAETCLVHWKVEFREAAVVVIDGEDDWIELDEIA